MTVKEWIEDEILFYASKARQESWTCPAELIEFTEADCKCKYYAQLLCSLPKEILSAEMKER